MSDFPEWIATAGDSFGDGYVSEAPWRKVQANYCRDKAKHEKGILNAIIFGSFPSRDKM